MNASLVACLARPARHAVSRSAFLPSRSLTRLQRSRSLLLPSPLVWTLGSSRNFSWNPFGGASSPSPTQTPASEAPPPPPAVLEEPSAASAQTSSQLPSDSSSLPLADADFGITDTLSSAVAELAARPPPLQYGDMAALGLASWSPAGFFPWLLETVQVSTGLPWWEVIVLTTIGARLALLPLIIRTTRSQAIMAPLQKQIQEFNQRSLKMRQAGDIFGARQVIQQQQMLIRKAGVNPFESLLTAATQATVQIGFFLGLRRMCTAPVEQLKDGGFGWITDLTAADPTYILPLANFIFANIQLSLSKRDMLASGSPNAGHIVNGMRLFTVIACYFVVYFPAGLNIHLITSIAVMSVQTLLLRIPALRKAFSLPMLPPIPGTKPPSFKDTLNSFKAWYKRRMDDSAIKHAERQRKIRMAVQKQRPRL